MTHPGATWDRISVRSPYEPLVWIEGRRSFVAGWPPGAVCEKCQAVQEPGQGGYVGPTPPGSDKLTYPRADVRYVCVSCARGILGLAPDELTGHGCTSSCQEGLCVDMTMQTQGVISTLGTNERIAFLEKDYAQRGWKVVVAQPVPNGPRTSMGENWAIGIVPAKEGIWPR